MTRFLSLVILYDTFVTPSKNNKDYSSISTITAEIIVDVLYRKKIRISHSTLTYLIKSLSSSDKQTRFFSSKALFSGVQNHLFIEKVDYTDLLEVQMYLHDPLVSVSIYLTIFYVEGLHDEYRRVHIDGFKKHQNLQKQRNYSLLKSVEKHQREIVGIFSAGLGHLNKLDQHDSYGSTFLRESLAKGKYKDNYAILRMKSVNQR